MPRRVRVLDQVTVNKIAAGEVVESPSSVVKELVENSLDAGSTEIELHLDRGGIERIAVIDNGMGMSREDAELAFTRHTTSKIKDIDDLRSLTSLGFRGEALASISAVANVEMLTRERGSGDEAGCRIVVSAGRVIALEQAGCPEGTRISVTDIFENVPARKRFLKSVQAEKARSMDIFQRLMLVHPEVGFRMIVDGEERSTGRSGSGLRNRTAEVLGVKTAKGMIDLKTKDVGPIRITGLISLPWETRSNSAGMTISIGGRIVRNRSIIEAVRRGYGSRLMKGRYPLAIIFLSMDGSEVDVNVHPTKDIVKFGNEAEVQNTVESMVSGTLFSGPTAAVGQRARERHDSGGAPDDGLPSPYIDSPSRRPAVQRTPRQVPLMEGEVRPQETGPGPWNQVPSIEGMETLPPALPESARSGRIRIIGQLDRSYVLCEMGGDLILVDQHAAHERIRLEMLKKKHLDEGFSTQELLEPIQLELDHPSMVNLSGMESDLADMGFVFERFGPDLVSVRGLPQFLGRIEGHEVLRDMVTGNEHHEGCSYPDESFQIELPLRERMIALTACRGAIKAHRALSLKEMEGLLEDLFKCEVPLHCAHGRPTMVRLPLAVLEKWFKRVL